MKTSWIVFVLLLLLTPASTALAKGEVLTRVTISGPGIEGTIEITDPNSLNGLGYFELLYDWGHPSAPHVGAGFELTRFYSPEEGGPVSDRLDYYPTPSGRPGYIYLLDGEKSPAPGQHWFYASARGDATLRRLLKQAGAKLPTASEAGAWDVIAVDSVLTQIQAREDVVLGFTIHPNAEMLHVPNDLLVYIRLPESATANVFFAQADGKPNHYSVKLEFPSAGQWYWTVGTSSDIGQQLMPALTVVDDSPANQSASSSAVSSESSTTQAPASAADQSNAAAARLALALAASLIGVIGVGAGLRSWLRARGHRSSAG